MWLVLVPQLPASSVVELGLQTRALTRGELPILHSLWGKLAELTSVFREIFERGSPAAKSAALDTLHRAVDAEFTELGKLWPEHGA